MQQDLWLRLQRSAWGRLLSQFFKRIPASPYRPQAEQGARYRVFLFTLVGFLLWTGLRWEDRDVLHCPNPINHLPNSAEIPCVLLFS